MQTDRTTKILLFAIAAALWVQIGRGLFNPQEAAAQKKQGATQKGPVSPLEVNLVSVGGKSVIGGIPIEGGVLSSIKPVTIKGEVSITGIGDRSVVGGAIPVEGSGNVSKPVRVKVAD